MHYRAPNPVKSALSGAKSSEISRFRDPHHGFRKLAHFISNLRHNQASCPELFPSQEFYAHVKNLELAATANVMTSKTDTHKNALSGAKSSEISTIGRQIQ